MGLLWTIDNLWTKVQTKDKEITRLEGLNKDALDQAKTYANRPRTDDDVTDRLCEWYKRAAKSEGKSDKQLLTMSCP